MNTTTGVPADLYRLSDAQTAVMHEALARSGSYVALGVMAAFQAANLREAGFEQAAAERSVVCCKAFDYAAARRVAARCPGTPSVPGDPFGLGV